MSYQEYTVKIYDNGTKHWFQNGKCHRLDGPAIEHFDGSKEWFQENELHRLDGPALELPNGNKYWYQKGKPHRLDGPAVEFANGSKEWYIKGKEYTEEEYKKAIKTINSEPSCEGKVVEIDGKKYTLKLV